jgi:hypothetical protein
MFARDSNQNHDLDLAATLNAKARSRKRELLGLVQDLCRFAYFFNSAKKFATTVTDWLTCCATRTRSIFLPSGATS